MKAVDPQSKPAAPLVSVVIPTRLSAPQLLDQCLKSLSRSRFPSAEFEVIVVVNAGAGSGKLPQRHPGAKFIRLERNAGFAGAVNAGIRAARADKLVLLNDDTVVDPNWLSELVQTQQNTGADMVASKIYLAASRKIDSQGFSYAWRGKAWPLQFKDGRWTSPIQSYPDHWLSSRLVFKSNDPAFWQEPFGPDGAAALYTRHLIESVGSLDNSFFAYLEDVELALRARKAGFRCVLAERALVWHHKHQTSSRLGHFKARQDLVNWWRIVIKHYHQVSLLRYTHLILLERLRNLNGYLKNLGVRIWLSAKTSQPS